MNRHVLQDLKLIERNRRWLMAPLPPGAKLAYYPSLAWSYLALAAGRRRQVNYLDRPFAYDNPATPLNLQAYPYEVGVLVLGHMTAAPSSALDVGANIGQFARTLAYLVPGCDVDAIEPNPHVFGTLQANAKASAITPYNCALGATAGKAAFYYEPGRSSVGSFVRENAGNQRRLREIEVEVVDDVSRVTGRQDYDLVKIDVEGSEYDVLSSLERITARYLFVEASGGGRRHHYTDAALLGRIQTTLGDFNIRYASGVDRRSITYEFLAEFV